MRRFQIRTGMTSSIMEHLMRYTKGAMIIKNFTMAIILCAPLYCLMSAQNVQAKDIEQKYNRQIIQLLKQGDCGKAEELAAKAEVEDNSLSYLPEWYFQIIDCYKSRNQAWGNLEGKIADYYDRQLDKLIKRKACKEAENRLTKMDKKYHAFWGYPSWLYKVARCYELTDVNKSLSLYQQIIETYPKSDKSIEAKFRVNWLKGDRSWIYPQISMIRKGVLSALRAKDVKKLAHYASKSYFYKGFEEDMRPSIFDDKLEGYLIKTFKHSELIIGPTFAYPKKYSVLVVIPSVEYPFWYFEFDEMEGGWQWTGIMISNINKDEPIR